MVLCGMREPAQHLLRKLADGHKEAQIAAGGRQMVHETPNVRRIRGSRLANAHDRSIVQQYCCICSGPDQLHATGSLPDWVNGRKCQPDSSDAGDCCSSSATAEVCSAVIRVRPRLPMVTMSPGPNTASLIWPSCVTQSLPDSQKMRVRT